MRHWQALGHSDQVVWGECQGSGAEPYKTQIALDEPGFKCSCPSRKFPCKHGLALFLLFESSSQSFKNNTQPDWVNTWLAAREQRAQKRAKKRTKKQDTKVDPIAQAKRVVRREENIHAGIEELERWTNDLVANGLAAAQTKPFAYWSTPAARLVDAQAQGLGRRVQELGSIPLSGAGWQTRFLEQLAQMHLLLEGFKRIDRLAPETQNDIRGLIGFTQNQDEILLQEGVHDRWMVLARTVDRENTLRVQRTWLWGHASERMALILDFAHAHASIDTTLVPCSQIDATLTFYSGAYPLRALIKQRNANPEPIVMQPGYASIHTAIEAFAQTVSRFPWLEGFPLVLRHVIPMQLSDRWLLRDASDCTLPFDPGIETGWQLLAVSGGRALNVFGEWNGERFLPLSLWTADRFITLSMNEWG